MNHMIRIKNYILRSAKHMKKCSVAREGGMTVLELIVVMSIFAIMASIVLFRFDTFNAKVSLNNLAQDIALRIVEAQKAAISGRDIAYDIGETAPTYGVNFTSNVSAGPDNTQFTFFTDINGNRLYDAPISGCPAVPTAGNECNSVTSLTGGEYISDICYTSFGASNCVPTPAQADITFTRPFPDATIHISTVAVPVDVVFIEVSSRDGTAQKTIVATSLGQVRVYDGKASTFGI